jgi:hypothetical protein
VLAFDMGHTVRGFVHGSKERSSRVRSLVATAPIVRARRNGNRARGKASTRPWKFHLEYIHQPANEPDLTPARTRVASYSSKRIGDRENWVRWDVI